MTRKICLAGERLVKEFEGLSLTAYKDSVGVETIGFGTTGKNIHEGMTITEAQAEAFLQADLAKFEAAVQRLVHHPLNDNEFAALVSLTYNVGAGALVHTHLATALNKGQMATAADCILAWNHAGGHVLAGLTRRREAERKLFLTPV